MTRQKKGKTGQRGRFTSSVFDLKREIKKGARMDVLFEYMRMFKGLKRIILIQDKKIKKLENERKELLKHCPLHIRRLYGKLKKE